MFNIFFKKNYKNDVYKVEIINMKELEKIKESNISLEEKSDDKDISENNYYEFKVKKIIKKWELENNYRVSYSFYYRINLSITCFTSIEFKSCWWGWEEKYFYLYVW